ncbi:helix-turn-helix domain-containing protein [Enterococcus sp. LJL128]
MEDIKDQLGKKIRVLREEKGLSRAEFCDTEAELTVRQLVRIEAGESLPTLPKLDFIAKQLSVPVSQLIDKEHVELPKRYLQLKHRLYRLSTYNEKERLLKQEKYFSEIYENYYSRLPEEEQLAIDVQQAAMDVHLTENADFGEGLLNDYFYQIMQKKKYTTNDLLIINLYFHCIFYNNYDEKIFILIVSKVVDQVAIFMETELFLLSKLLLTAVTVMEINNRYEKMIEIVSVSERIMEINQDFQKKPVMDMIEGKYYLHSQGNIKIAKQKYQEGAQLAQLHRDQVLSEKIMLEWESDLEMFQTKKDK